ncbi:MAG: sulfotransferase family protein [Pseudomonadota bacterium]
MTEPGKQTEPLPGFVSFVARVRRDATLLAALRRERDPAALVVQSSALAGSAGYRFDESEVLAQLEAGRRAWLMQWLPEDREAEPPALRSDDGEPPGAEWIPYRVAMVDGRLAIDWCHLDAARLIEPFFHSTIVSAASTPFNLVFRWRTGIEALDALPQSLAPSGFLFHLSRCGSTLCAQALAANPRHIVVSEAAPLDFALRHPALDETQRVRLLRGLMRAWGRPRANQETQLFVKLMASHLLHLPTLRSAFPELPWLFVYRDPVEIMVSQERNLSAEFARGAGNPGRFGLTVEEVAALDDESHLARVLAAIAAVAVDEIAAGAGRLAHHEELSSDCTSVLREAFALPAEAFPAAALEHIARRHAKFPGEDYLDDRAQKQAEASSALRIAAQRYLLPHYEALERLRAARHSRAMPIA